MNDIPTFTINDVKNNMNLEKLIELKKDFYAHRFIRTSFGDEYKEQCDNLDKVTRGLSAWIQGLCEETIDNLSQENDALCLFLCADTCFEQSRYKEAAEFYEKTTNAGGSEKAIFCLVENLVLSEQFDKAKEKIASLPANHPETHYCNGVLNESLLNHEEAINNYNNCLEGNPHHRYALFHLGQIYNRFGNDEEAIRYYEKCREELPVILSCLVNLGILYEDSMKLQEAVYCFEEVLETDSNNERAKLYLKDVNESFNMQYDEESERFFDHQNRIMKMRICDFELSVRSRNCLERMNIYTISDLVNKSESELLSYPNFGETSLQEIKEILTSKNIQLGQKLTPTFSRQGGGRPGSQDQIDPKLKTSIATLKLSVRSTKVLETLGVLNLGQLVAFTEDQLMAQKNFGSTSIREIKSKLIDYGLELAPKKNKRQSEDDSILASMKPRSIPQPGIGVAPLQPVENINFFENSINSTPFEQPATTPVEIGSLPTMPTSGISSPSEDKQVVSMPTPPLDAAEPLTIVTPASPETNEVETNSENSSEPAAIEEETKPEGDINPDVASS